jgi:hypothetical protein
MEFNIILTRININGTKQKPACNAHKKRAAEEEVRDTSEPRPRPRPRPTKKARTEKDAETGEAKNRDVETGKAN